MAAPGLFPWQTQRSTRLTPLIWVGLAPCAARLPMTVGLVKLLLTWPPPVSR